MKTRHPGMQKQESLIREWKDVPEGTPIMFRRTTHHEEEPSKTRSAPFMLGGHTACIMIDGVSGAFSLEFIRKV